MVVSYVRERRYNSWRVLILSYAGYVCVRVDYDLDLFQVGTLIRANMKNNNKLLRAGSCDSVLQNLDADIVYGFYTEQNFLVAPIGFSRDDKQKNIFLEINRENFSDEDLFIIKLSNQLPKDKLSSLIKKAKDL